MGIAGTFAPTPCRLCWRPITLQSTYWRVDGKGGVWFDEYRQPSHMACHRAIQDDMERMMNLVITGNPHSPMASTAHVAYTRLYPKQPYMEMLSAAVEGYTGKLGVCPCEMLLNAHDMISAGLVDGSGCLGCTVYSSARVDIGVALVGGPA